MHKQSYLLNTINELGLQLSVPSCIWAHVSKGLGKLQQAIKRTILEAESYGVRSVTFADIRKVTAIRNGGSSLRPTFERSLKRALRTLIQRREVIIVGGGGGRWSPYRYATMR
jgi:hypothetical protein